MDEAAGDLALLDEPLAIELLNSRFPARLSYIWFDETPRVVPIWFHWTGSAIVMCSPAKAPKLRALERNPAVAVTIDSAEWPYRVLSLRGDATVTMEDDVAAEYASAAKRYLGPEAGAAWVDQVRGMRMGRVVVEPRWANLLDFEHRLPSALSA